MRKIRLTESIIPTIMSLNSCIRGPLTLFLRRVEKGVFLNFSVKIAVPYLNCGPFNLVIIKYLTNPRSLNSYCSQSRAKKVVCKEAYIGNNRVLGPGSA